MFDAEQLLGQMLGGALGDAFGGRKSRRKSSMFNTGDLATKATVGIGLLGVAMAAYEHYSQKPAAAPQQAATVPPPLPASAMPPPPPPASAMPPPTVAAPPPPPPPPADSALSDTGLRASAPPNDMVLLMQAMIAAAAADGAIDADEKNGILARAASSNLDAESRAFLERELAQPKTAEQIAAFARPAIAADVYAASAWAISVDTPAERLYLERLGTALGLDGAQRSAIHAQLGLA